MKTILMILLVLTLSISVFGQEYESIALELKEELQLSDAQADKVSGLIEKFANELNAVIQKHETEKSDPQSFLQDIKTVREQYKKDLAGILTEDQMKAYLAYVDKVFDEIVSDIVEIKLLDLKPALDLSDDQIAPLTPVLTKSIRGVLSTIYEYADKRMGLRNKLKLGKALKKIQSNARTDAQKILSDAQMKKWDELKEKQKAGNK